MDPRLRFHRVSPTVLKVGATCTVRIEPLFEHVTPPDGASLTAVVAERDTRRRHALDVSRNGRALELTFTPATEQEYAVILTTTRDGETVRREEFALYALEADLHGLRPWKGDFHIHSNRSDGREAPAYVAAACRRIGLDFMALTDHRKYGPSLEARDAFARVATDLRIFPGEEVHPPDNPVHMVNFGGGASINAMFADPAFCESGIGAVDARLDVDLPADEKRVFASCVWVFDRIREAGGIGVLCHPYWITGDGYNISEPLQAAFYARRPFDALEIIGGYYRHQLESNALAVARWQEERSKGRAMPVVGVSDAHGCERGELFGWYYSVVFAPSAGFADLRRAILDERSVAVEAVEGEFPRLHGPFRLVKLAYFLLREIFPFHDELCAEEGRSMHEFLAGEADAASRLAALQGRVPALYDRLWGNGGP